MAVIDTDPGGEYYFSLTFAQAVTAKVWSFVSGSATLVNNAPAGRQAASDGKVYAIKMTARNDFIGKNLATGYNHLIIGCAYYVSTSAFTVNTGIIQFKSGGQAGTVLIQVQTDGTGHLQFMRSSNGTNQVGTTSTQILPTGWNYIEVEIVFATGATGTAKCWLNGVLVINATSVQTSSTTTSDTLLLISLNADTIYIKDYYLLDASTGANTTVLGDISVLVKYPNSAGVNQQWTPLTSTQVSQVQDGINHTGTWPDGDTTYIFDSSAGSAHISDFGHEALTLAGVIYSVMHVSYVRKDDATSRTFRQVCLSGGTTETNGSDIASTTTYAYYFDPLDTDPNTSAQWGTTGYNAATFGVKYTS